MEKTVDSGANVPASNKNRKILIFMLSIAAALLLAVAFFVGRLMFFANNPKDAFEPPAPTTPEPTVTATPTPEPTPDEGLLPLESFEIMIDPEPDPEPLTAEQLEFMKDRVNLLLLGVDISEEREGTKRQDFRTDVMMLLSIDFQNKKVYMVSVPRDSYTKIYKSNVKYKINGAFAAGGGLKGNGFEYAKQTVSLLFGGVPVQYHAAVKMSGIKNVVDSIGGVDYDVDIEIRLNGRVLKTGMQHLDGQQVLDYCRARKGISTDVGRIDRQQRILFEVFRQMKASKNLLKIPKIYLGVKDDVYTNLTLEQMAALASFAMQLEPEDITRYTLKGEYMTAYNAAYYVLDQYAKVKLVKEVFGIDVKPMIKYDLSYVKNEASGDSADKAILRAKKLLTGSYALSREETESLEDQIRTLTHLVDDKAGYKKISDATDKLNKLCADIEKAHKNKPAVAQPSPSANPSATPTPSSSAPTPSHDAPTPAPSQVAPSQTAEASAKPGIPSPLPGQ